MHLRIPPARKVLVKNYYVVRLYYVDKHWQKKTSTTLKPNGTFPVLMESYKIASLKCTQSLHPDDCLPRSSLVCSLMQYIKSFHDRGHPEVSTSG
ncbi:unnamed protein product, partial [Brenthis ino]